MDATAVCQSKALKANDSADAEIEADSVERLELKATNVKGTVSTREWISVELAGKLLSVSSLHIRLLVRDEVLRSRASSNGVEIKTEDVLAYLPMVKAAQKEFASDVARTEEIRARIIEMSA